MIREDFCLLISTLIFSSTVYILTENVSVSWKSLFRFRLECFEFARS
nr:MAG TPA: hypothetical protein [Caudoviricetes sp.]